jgi:hypothetical protein
MEDSEPKGSVSNIGTSDLSKKKHLGVSPAGVSTVPPSIPSDRGLAELNSLSFSDYHLTVQLQVHLERRQISLLLGILCYQAVHYGVTFGSYLCLLHLNEILLGNKVRASQIKEKFERLSVLLSQTIIRDLAGKDLNFTDLVQVSDQTRNLILNSKSLMTKDSYNSRFNHWRPERYLKLRIVPVDVIIERNGNSVRYTSYCKGYGEGTGTARRGKTPQSFELDGEDTPEWKLSEQSLSAQEFTQQVFLLAHFEWLKRFGTED